MEKTKLSKWFILFVIIWTVIFIMFGIESGEGTEPTEDSNAVLDTIYIIASPFVMAALYYFLYSKFNKWLVFLSAPLLGMAMEWLLFKPADVLNESSNLEATLFFAFIWSVILIPPYWFTIFADKSKRNLIITITLIVAFFIFQVLNLTVF